MVTEHQLVMQLHIPFDVQDVMENLLQVWGTISELKAPPQCQNTLEGCNQHHYVATNQYQVWSFVIRTPPSVETYQQISDVVAGGG